MVGIDREAFPRPQALQREFHAAVSTPGSRRPDAESLSCHASDGWHCRWRSAFWLWANTASYDVRNVLGLLLISAFIPALCAGRARSCQKGDIPDRPRWSVPDGAIAIGLAVLCVGLTLPLAQGDKDAEAAICGRTAPRRLAGLKSIGTWKSCSFGAAPSSARTSTSARFRPSADSKPDESLPLLRTVWMPCGVRQFSESTGCTSILYQPRSTHPSVLSFVVAYADARGLKKLAEGNGFELLGSDP